MMSLETRDTIFPSVGHQTLSSLVHLLGCSLLAACFARRFNLKNMTFAKACMLAIFLDSWLFVFSAGVVVQGVGMSYDISACLSGIYLCIFLCALFMLLLNKVHILTSYASSKILIYLFLAEKVRIVWGAGKLVGRMKSRVWLVCCFVLLGYLAILILMLIAKIAYFREDRTCIIGLRTIATIPLLTYDVFLNLFLTGLFVWPLLRRRISTDNLRNLATRTCWAAAVALTTSVINILILTLLHGQQLGWVCLASCGLDVTINAVVIFAVTHRSDSSNQSESDSPKAFSTDKHPGIASPRAAMFKKGTPHLNGSSIRISTFPQASVSPGEDSEISLSNMISKRPFNREEMYDYLPKDQVPTLDSDETISSSQREKSDSSICVVNRDSDGSTIQPAHISQLKSSARSSFVIHERSRSRGFLAEFYNKIGMNNSPQQVEEMAIQVSVSTESTPANNSPISRINTNRRQFFSSDDVAKAV